MTKAHGSHRESQTRSGGPSGGDQCSAKKILKAIALLVAMLGTWVQAYGQIPVMGDTNIAPVEDWIFVGPQALEAYEVSGIGYGNGVWTATTVGWATTLPDGANHWSYPGPVTISADEGWSRMDFLGGYFVWWGVGEADEYVNGTPEVVLSIPKMLISTDGLAWEPAAGVSNAPDAEDPFARVGRVESAVYGNGAYVAVGEQGINTQNETQQGAVWVSTNALNWTRIYRLQSPAYCPLHSVAFGNGHFVGVGDNAAIVTSTNGFDWAETELTNTTSGLTGVGYGSNGWIVTEQSSSGQYLASSDGTNWSPKTASGAPSSYFYDCFYADGRYWFTSEGGCYTTVDCSSWNLVTGDEGKAMLCVRRAPDGVSPKYLAGYVAGAIYGSQDATNWTLLSSDGNGADAVWPNNQTVVASGTNWFVSGYTTYHAVWPWNTPVDVPGTSNLWTPGLVLAPSIWYADSSLDWRHGDPGALRVAVGDYVLGNQGVIAAGVNSYGGAPSYLVAGPLSLSGTPSFQGAILPNSSRSIDGEPFYKGLPVAGTAYCHTSLARTPYGYDLFVEAGSVGGQFPGINWGHFQSLDGTNWTRHVQGLNNPTNFPGIRGLAYGAGLYVAAGSGASPDVPVSGNRIYTSVDGENYAPVDLSAMSPAIGAEGLTGLAFGGGAFVAIGDQGRILYSTNGLNWQSAYNSDGTGWNRVRYLNSNWVAVGDAGRIAVSVDGINWTIKFAGVLNDLNDIATMKGYYLIVGDNAMVLLSTFHVPQPPIILAGSLTYSGTTFQFTVQTDPGVLPAIQSSDDLVIWTNITLNHTAPDGSGSVTFRDPDAGSHPRRFYRASLQ